MRKVERTERRSIEEVAAEARREHVVEKLTVRAATNALAAYRARNMEAAEYDDVEVNIYDVLDTVLMSERTGVAECYYDEVRAAALKMLFDVI